MSNPTAPASEPQTIHLTRRVDFYEAYGEGAVTLARQMNITLTGIVLPGSAHRVSMSGIPAHALDRYTARLGELGYRVTGIEGSDGN